ncbi:MAG: PP2C family protein-serine/threonine phosphatase [Monoglobaceae bacterium]
MNLTYSTFTDPGSRKVNEDSIGVCNNEENNCFILCDGLGGHGMGDVASLLVVDVFKSQFEKCHDCSEFLGSTFLAAQDVLMAKQSELHAERKMKTTAVSVVTDNKNAYIGHVGDSRLYIFSRNKVKRRTLDHSIPQMLVLSKDIKDSEIRNHPDRNVLLRVLGIDWEEPMYELIKPIPLKKCQAFLLCSDGFWELIEENEMCELLKKAKTVNEWLDNMVDVVRTNGKGRNMDNFSAIAVWLGL